MAAPAALLERLRDRGWRMTPQRRVVAEVLRGEHVHLTAEEILTSARHSLPEISLATVYNTLNDLVAMGEVREVRVDGGPARYDPNVVDVHHHLTCESCGALYDVVPEGVDGLTLRRGDRHGFRITGVEVLFRGRCRACASTSA